MKKTSLLVLLPAVALSAVLLTGCGIFRSHKAWDQAKQESPLEIPPSLDRPSTSAALVIPPPGANQPSANGATADTAAGNGRIADGFVVSDSVDNTYQRVGKVLKDGTLGKLVSNDGAAHTYTVNVAGGAKATKKRGFFSRMFHHDKADVANGGEGAGSGTNTVQVTVSGSGTSASQVQASGNAGAVAKVIDALKSKLGNL